MTDAIHLTHKEQGIMDALKRRAGETLTRREIATEVFGREFMETNLVDVHIGNIRGKLGAQVITTVRGKGYAFNTGV